MKEFDMMSEQELASWGEQLGKSLNGGETVELVGDVGAGKTTLTRSIARGLGISGTISSPTFTISNRYDCRDGLTLVHYDFYRLHDAGILHDELEETIHDPKAITVIEWGDTVKGVLPGDRLTIHITPLDEGARHVVLTSGGPKTAELLGGL